MAKKKQGRDQRRAAHLAKLQQSAGGAAETRKARARDAAEQAAAAQPSAARWVVADDAGARIRDVVADLLAMDPRASLQGRGERELRELAGDVVILGDAGAVCPSGQPVLDALVLDAAVRASLAPQMDLDALLTGATIRSTDHDRTVRTATALLAARDAHRDGTRDLHALVAAQPRHPLADEVDAVVAAALGGRVRPVSFAPAIAEAEGGWLSASPWELFVTASHGQLSGGVAEAVGEPIARWLATFDPTRDVWAGALAGIVAVDPAALLQEAAARAGSDHPKVVASGLVDLIALRHPIGH